MCGTISDPGMEPFPLRVLLSLRNPGWGFHTVRGGLDPGDQFFSPGLLDLNMYRRIYNPGMGPYLPRVSLALRTPGWGFHTVRGGIDPRGDRFCPRFVGIVDVWKISDPGMDPYYLRVVLSVVIRGHPRYIPGFPIGIWILGYNGCCSLLLGTSRTARYFFFSEFFSGYNEHLLNSCRRGWPTRSGGTAMLASS